MKLARTLIKMGAWLVGAAVLVLAAWIGINATDEQLSGEARAARELLQPPPAPGKDNAFLDMLVLTAPEGVPTFDAALERLNAINHQSGGKITDPPWVSAWTSGGVPTCG